jgi:glycosyltransferase involved in cell wall biosynthesis
MKIAMVSEQASPLAPDLAQGDHVAELAKSMSALGHEVTVYTRRLDSTSPERVHTEDGYDVVRVSAGPARELTEDETVTHLGDFAEFLAGQWRLRPPDVVHAHHWTSGLVAVIGAHRVGAHGVRVPVVHSHHGFGSRGAKQRSDAEGLVARRATWAVATNSAEAAKLPALGARRTRISTVPCGVDLGLFHPDGPVVRRNRLKRVVTAGEPGPGNGFSELLTVTSTMDDVELVVVGEHARAHLRRHAGDLGMADRVVFTGAVPRADRPALLRSADVVACTPSAEPFGIMTMEAMACGVPVVATDTGVLADAVVLDVTGLLVAPHDVRALARALRRSLGDETLRQQFGSAARDRTAARYSTRRLAADLVAVYEQADLTLSGRTTSQETG